MQTSASLRAFVKASLSRTLSSLRCSKGSTSSSVHAPLIMTSLANISSSEGRGRNRIRRSTSSALSTTAPATRIAAVQWFTADTDADGEDATSRRRLGLATSTSSTLRSRNSTPTPIGDDAEPEINFELDLDPSRFDIGPEDIVAHLDSHIVGQADAKRAVAVAMRTRWCRMQLSEDMQKEVSPHNVLLIGPTGSGKTEIARRVASLANSPYIKVEATRYTEVGMVGSNTDTMIKELVEVAYKMELKRLDVLCRPAARRHAIDLVTATFRSNNLANRTLFLNLGMPENTTATFAVIRSLLESGQLDSQYITMELPTVELPPEARPANLNDNSEDMVVISGGGSVSDFNKLLSGGEKKKKKSRRVLVSDALKVLEDAQVYKIIDYEAAKRNAIRLTEESGIIFLDEIDKIARNLDGVQVLTTGGNKGEGVQKELLSLIEGTLVNTPRGAIRTDHILFIGSGAFYQTKPRHLLPELQGRLPIQVTLKQLTAEELLRVLTEPQFSIVRQKTELFATEGVNLTFTNDGLTALANLAFNMNTSLDNTGARRLTEVVSRVLAEDQFSCVSRVRRERGKVDQRNALTLSIYEKEMEILQVFAADIAAVEARHAEQVTALKEEFKNEVTTIMMDIQRQCKELEQHTIQKLILDVANQKQHDDTTTLEAEAETIQELSDDLQLVIEEGEKEVGYNTSVEEISDSDLSESELSPSPEAECIGAHVSSTHEELPKILENLAFIETQSVESNKRCQVLFDELIEKEKVLVQKKEEDIAKLQAEHAMHQLPEKPVLEVFPGYDIVVDAEYVKKHSTGFLEKADLTRFLL